MSLSELLEIEIDISETRKSSLKQSPSTISIITRQEIAKRKYLTLADTLMSIPGFDVQNTVIDRNVVTARGDLQNFYSNKVLLMINGIPSWQPTYGEGYLSKIDVNSIERIEIISGPSSVLYGTNAFIAVINVVLRNQTNNIEASFSSDINNSYRSSFLISESFNYLKFMVNFGTFHNRNNPIELKSANNPFYNGDSTFQFDNTYTQRKFTTTLSYKGHSLLLNNYENNFNYMGANHSYLSGGNNFVFDGGTLISYNSNHNLTNDLNFSSLLSYEFFKRDFALSADRYTAIELNSERVDSRLNLNYKPNDSWSFDLWANAEFNRSKEHNAINPALDIKIRENIPTNSNYYATSVFGQIQYSYSFLNLQAGSRYTYNSIFGDNISSRFTSNFNINSSNVIKLIYAEAFRTPSLLELYFDHPTVIGNQNLNPEKNYSYEFSYLTTQDELYFQLTAYYQSIDNLIKRFTPETGPPSE